LSFFSAVDGGPEAHILAGNKRKLLALIININKRKLLAVIININKRKLLAFIINKQILPFFPLYLAGLYEI
jgi:hypothetical protein